MSFPKFASSLLLCAWVVGCSSPPVERGTLAREYQPPFKQLRFGNGESLAVYRVKYRVFGDGNAPALQLEFASPGPIEDTVSVRQLAIRVWPTFRPYLDSLQLTTAVLTATALMPDSIVKATGHLTRSFGLIARRDSSGVWRLLRNPAALPSTPAPAGAGIFEATGTPFSISKLPRQ